MQRKNKLAAVLVLLLAAALVGCSAEKSNIMEVDDNMYNGFFSGIVNRIKGDATKQDAQDQQNDHIKDFHVEDDIRYYYLIGDSAERKLAKKVAEKMLVSDSHMTYDLNPRFRIGNMAFVEVTEIPTVFVHDRNNERYFVVVILDIEPRMVHTPDKELFAKFMNAVRVDPDLMTLTQRLEATLILATGGIGEVIIEDGIEPSWTDEDGILIISCHTYIRSTNGRALPKRVVCTLTVDKNQDFTQENRDF